MQFMQSIMDKNRKKIDTRRLTRGLLLIVFCCLFFIGGCSSLPKQENAIKMPINEQETPSPVSTLLNLAPNKGLKTAPLFETPLRNTEMRVDRLESSVQQIKNDFDSIVPSVVRLVAIEQDIIDLIEQLEILIDEDGVKQDIIEPINIGDDILPSTSLNLPDQQASAINKPIPLSAPKKDTKEQATALHAIISDLSIKENSNATRVVLTMSSKVKSDIKIQKDGKMLDVKLFNSDWTGENNWQSEFSPLISSYNVVQKGKDQQLSIKLNFVSKIIKTDVLPAKLGKNYQLIIDLQSEAIHFP